MPPRTSWSNLLPGLIALAVVVSIAIGVIVFAGVGRERGDTQRLYVLANQAQGVMGGTEVWLVGQKVGTVDRVEFASPNADTAMRVVLVLTVKRDAAQQIRHDSRAQIRMGGTVIGPAIVYVSAGTPGSLALADGDTLRAQAQADAVGAGGRLLETASQEFGPLLADARTILARARRRNEAMRQSLTEVHDGEVSLLRDNVSRLRDLFDRSGDTRGGRADVITAAQTALARADSIRALVNSPSTSLGRFRRDTAFGGSIAALRDELSRVRAQMNSVDGNMGRMARDSAMTRAIGDAQREMTLLFDDFRRRPSRYIVF